MSLSECVRVSERCRQVQDRLENEEIVACKDRLADAIRLVARSWSRSWIGYHAHVYYVGFQQPAPSDHFSSEWGFEETYFGGTSRNWREVTLEDVEHAISKVAGEASWKPILAAAGDAKKELKELQRELQDILARALDETNSPEIEEIRDKVRGLSLAISASEFAQLKQPRGNYITRDMVALGQGLTVPHHIQVEARLNSTLSVFVRAGELGELADQGATVLRRKNREEKRSGPGNGKVFIGHGRSEDWRQVASFLQDRLGVEWDEFNREPTAGMSVKERLEAMLEAAGFALLIMTAEDEHADNSMHARENVIHEVGLFQGRLGFRRAIVLLEDSCKEFSNIHGLVQLRYPAGYIKSAFEEIRQVLERESVIRGS